jgi:hypothetical protein
MAPEDFHRLITPVFKNIMSKLCKKTIVDRSTFTASEISKIEQTAVRLRIVLKLTRRPVTYCLKLNEALVGSLLSYHDLNALFTLVDFNAAVSHARVREARESIKETESDKKVVEICDSAYAKNEDIVVMSRSKEFDSIPMGKEIHLQHK